MASASALLINLLALLLFISGPFHVAHGCGITIVNKCSFQVTTCAQSGSSAISQYQIGAGASRFLDFGSACKWPSAAIYPSVTGNCANPDKALANLAEFNIGEGGGTDYYDLSNVNAYTLGLSISGPCNTITCSIPNISAFCQPPNQLRREPSGLSTCINTHGPGTGPTPSTNDFHRACPQAYSYSTDDSEVRTCSTGSNYQVTFCP